MTVHLDHAIVPARDKVASARLLAELLGVSWAPSSMGPFAPVYVNDGLTLDFIDTDEAFPVYHFCFRVDQQAFDSILGRIRAAGIEYRSTVRGPMDMQIDTQFGGSGIYWNEPEGHQWELLTVSYARQSSSQPQADPIVDEVRALERARLQALVASDLETARRLHATDFQLITPRGRALSKEQYLGAVANGDIKYLRWEPSAMEVRAHGDVALVRYEAQLEFASGGERRPPIRCWHTDTYERRGGAWQVVWSQATRIE